MASNISTRKTTIVLSAIFILLAFLFAVVFFIYPKCRKYYITHRQYEVYGGMTDHLKDCELFRDMESGKSFCFLGDSITCGAAIDDIPWYQPLIPYIKGSISNVSCSGWTAGDLINNKDSIPQAEVYVIAIGINDILFPYDGSAAQTAEVFTERLEQLSEMICVISPDAKIYFISPWPFVDVDDWYHERGGQFRAAFTEWSKHTDCICLNPEPYITSVFSENGSSEYMHNNFHPNAPEGVGLFSYAVLKACHEQRA